MEKWLNHKWLLFFIYTLLIILILYFLQQISPMLKGIYDFSKAILAPFLFAVIISYVLNPVVNLLQQRKVPRTISVLLIYAVFIFSLIVIVMNVIPMFMEQLKQLNEQFPEMSSKAQQYFRILDNNKNVPGTIREALHQSLIRLEQSIQNTISNFINDIGNTINKLFIAFIIPFLAFYMLKDVKLLQRAFLPVVPKTKRKGLTKLWSEIDAALGNYVRGQFLVCIVIGFLAYVGYWLIGMPYPLLMSSIVAVFNIIPYLGPFFGAAPAVIMASTVSLKMVLFVVLVNTIIQTLEGNVISPQIVGKSLHMHPLLIIFALLVGGQLAGIVGLILAVPFFAAMKVVVHHFAIYIIHRRT
ncbi:AI-2E family transporter [Longirhabdus pacifica]|uniref:AI-2E family transporter n=1 Tax=Longirhabdus pacifica TaxID=2305227 RepID=UPI001008A472|nr:AI-2E family transporter [Longirhabdus pacifica]